MYKAGYDPQAFISFFEKVQVQEKRKPGTISKAFSTHPQTRSRWLRKDVVEQVRKLFGGQVIHIVSHVHDRPAV